MNDDFYDVLLYGFLAAVIVALVIAFSIVVLKPWQPAGEYATNIVGDEFLTYAYTENDPRLESQLLFPDGWTPVLYASSGSADGRYICERDGEYRICIPKVVP